MSNNTYGTLGSEMKAMKDGRRSSMAGIRQDSQRIRADANDLLAAIRTDVAALKADAQRFLAQTGSDNAEMRAEARRFLARTGSDNAEMRAEARQFLAQTGSDNADLKAEARRFVAQAGSDNAELKVQTHQIIEGLCEVSGQRAADWRDVLRAVQNGRSPASAGAARRKKAAPAEPAKVKARKPRQSATRSRKRKAS